MIRILTVAVAATMLVAAPAAAQSTKVAVTGKSAEQLHADIGKAAKKVCNLAVVGASFPREMFAACYKASVADAVTRANDPALAAVANMKLASR
jgi:hypothetical protein